MMSNMTILGSNRPHIFAGVTFVALFCLIVTFIQSPTTLQQPSLPLSHWSSGRPDTTGGDAVNSTLGFERIFVVNMPERTDKRDNMILQASVSGLKLDFVSGVHPDAISTKSLPIHHTDDVKSTWVAAWRAHMNAISEIVRLNVTSALIMEDDIDWDVSLKQVIRDVARSMTAVSGDKTAMEMNLANSHLFRRVPFQSSPYGDEWDVIWLGHCGATISDQESRVVQHNDHTVPQPHYLHSWDPMEQTPLAIYPNHTRLVGHLTGGVCSLAYAVSQAGARRILYNMGIQYLDMGYDLMLRAFCTGTEGRQKHRCFGVLPPVFEHFRRAGSIAGDSDLHDVGTGVRDKGFTLNIRRSVALNMDKILQGSASFEDQFPDT